MKKLISGVLINIVSLGFIYDSITYLFGIGVCRLSNNDTPLFLIIMLISLVGVIIGSNLISYYIKEKIDFFS